MTIKVRGKSALIYASCGVVIVFIAGMALLEAKLKNDRYLQSLQSIYATNTQVSMYFYGLTKTAAVLTTTPTRMSNLTPTARR